LITRSKSLTAVISRLLVRADTYGNFGVKKAERMILE